MYCWLDGKTVVVTGASGGMGAGIAATLIKKHGCTVIGVARSEPKMLKFIEELGPTYAQQFSYKLFDVSVKENWENFYNELVEEGVQVDVLVNNAGICLSLSALTATVMKKLSVPLTLISTAACIPLRHFCPCCCRARTRALLTSTLPPR